MCSGLLRSRSAAFWRTGIGKGVPLENGSFRKCPFLEIPETQGNPPVLKILRRVSFGTGSKFDTEVAKRYGEGSEMLVFLGQKDRKTVLRW